MEPTNELPTLNLKNSIKALKTTLRVYYSVSFSIPLLDGTIHTYTRGSNIAWIGSWVLLKALALEV